LFLSHSCGTTVQILIHDGLERVSILGVLVPVPRKSQDIITILPPSLRLGSRHFDAERKGLGKKTDAVFEEIGIRHGRPYHPPSGRMGTVTVSYVTVD
jgi:hypothetical protein